MPPCPTLTLSLMRRPLHNSQEDVALELLFRFIAAGLPQYEAKRQYADARAVSKLSPYLHSGELSARRMYHEMLQANAKQARLQAELSCYSAYFLRLWQLSVVTTSIACCFSAPKDKMRCGLPDDGIFLLVRHCTGFEDGSSSARLARPGLLAAAPLAHTDAPPSPGALPGSVLDRRVFRGRKGSAGSLGEGADGVPARRRGDARALGHGLDAAERENGARISAAACPCHFMSFLIIISNSKTQAAKFYATVLFPCIRTLPLMQVCAAFLTEYLNIHWKEGAAWFHDTLVDADVAINSMMWQNAVGDALHLLLKIIMGVTIIPSSPPSSSPPLPSLSLSLSPLRLSALSSSSRLPLSLLLSLLSVSLSA